MKKSLLFLLLTITFTSFSQGRTRVKSYTKKNGTRVESHQRTKSNNTQKDNWSSNTNYNPNTGKRGSGKPKH